MKSRLDAFLGSSMMSNFFNSDNNTATTTETTTNNEIILHKDKPQIIGIYESKLNSKLPEKQGGVIRLSCLSDTHRVFESKYLKLSQQEKYSHIPQDTDILIHAGDFTSTGKLDEIQLFREFMNQVEVPHKIVIAGNHEITIDTPFYARRGKDFHRDLYSSQQCRATLMEPLSDSSFHYLENEGMTCCGLKFWGSPVSPEFYDWAFGMDRGPEIATLWGKIPSAVDVLITHGPPALYGSLCYNGIDAGCLDLLKRVRIVKPTLHVFGHIHEAFGIFKEDTVTFVNASKCTLKYQPLNPTIVVDMKVG
jgi:predicted phosphodiesterase